MASKVEEETLSWVRTLLLDPEVVLSDNLLSVGGHSMIVLELMARSEATFGAQFAIEVLFEGSLADAARELEGRLDGALHQDGG